MAVGIIGYGAYIPLHRIKVEEIAKVWGADAPSYKRGLMLQEKSVPAPDQDVITMSVEAARRAVTRSGINPQEIGNIYIGSESHPYAVKPSGTVVAEAIGATPHTLAADWEFACKAGTEAVQAAIGFVGSGMADYALAIGINLMRGRCYIDCGCGDTPQMLSGWLLVRNALLACGAATMMLNTSAASFSWPDLAVALPAFAVICGVYLTAEQILENASALREWRELSD